MKFYTGVGSRETPSIWLAEIERIAAALAQLGFTMRSGGAPGADTSFEESALKAGGLIELYLPWPAFNGRLQNVVLSNPSRDAVEMARGILGEQHWNAMMKAYLRKAAEKGYKPRNLAPAHKLHSRNIHQVLGKNLDTKSEFVVYWAPIRQGQVQGGTATAVKTAVRFGIPTFHIEKDSKLLWETINNYGG